MDAEISLEPNGETGVKMFDVEEHGGVGDDDDVPAEEIPTTGLLAPNLSEEEVLAFLDRDAEVQLAKQPGQGRYIHTYCSHWGSRSNELQTIAPPRCHGGLGRHAPARLAQAGRAHRGHLEEKASERRQLQNEGLTEFQHPFPCNLLLPSATKCNP